MKQRQADKKSGTPITFTLDPLSLSSLSDAKQFLKDYGNHFSYSVLVRRALRFYREHLRGTGRAASGVEVTELMRAAKGVM